MSIGSSAVFREAARQYLVANGEVSVVGAAATCREAAAAIASPTRWQTACTGGGAASVSVKVLILWAASSPRSVKQTPPQGYINTNTRAQKSAKPWKSIGPEVAKRSPNGALLF
jgi:hypothetical protein